jgi:8-oxo-dGTP pyrophosphatase MutT (NUDIX family)
VTIRKATSDAAEKPADIARADGVRTHVVPGVVDVVVLRRAVMTDRPASAGRRPSGHPWQVLTLRRGAGTRCTGAWEIVHGRIERNERAEDAAVREVLEETGLAVSRLYNVTVGAFYLHQIATIELTIVFAAVIIGDAPTLDTVTLGSEHDAYRWQSFPAATRALAWPREHEALRHVAYLLRSGDAGAAEDVLRIF